MNILEIFNAISSINPEQIDAIVNGFAKMGELLHETKTHAQNAAETAGSTHNNLAGIMQLLQNLDSRLKTLESNTMLGGAEK